MKPKAKAGCKLRESEAPGHEAAKVPGKGSRGKRVSAVSTPEDLEARQKTTDAKKLARMEAAQIKANEACTVVRASGIEDVQPPLGFTAKYRDCTNARDVAARGPH